MNTYGYVNQNPIRFTDPQGLLVTPETAVDLISLGFSVDEFKRNPNFLNGLGVAFDGIGALIPFVPAGVGIIRQCDNIADIVKRKLPVLDSTGKVHGELPRPKDLGKYGADELRQLQKELKQSVRERIRKTVEKGPDRAHGQRQGAEQDLIQAIEKHLSGS